MRGPPQRLVLDQAPLSNLISRTICCWEARRHGIIAKTFFSSLCLEFNQNVWFSTHRQPCMSCTESNTISSLTRLSRRLYFGAGKGRHITSWCRIVYQTEIRGKKAPFELWTISGQTYHSVLYRTYVAVHVCFFAPSESNARCYLHSLNAYTLDYGVTSVSWSKLVLVL